MDQPTVGGADLVKAKVRSVVESFIRSATLSHLRDAEAVQQYVEHQTDACLDALMRTFKIERKQ